ncbi:uncharacterized protein F5891DRAFT_1023873 [Suillus fuscotomentosus]|uniref:Uncharacterized protein n=1 Tax=Suillus fuscotomentosus TaxID=1912939 RepID=A0AAD4EAK8_9AGAM|nr:uncharacterized protein F5891DRAFT_1023873 [Suillus fuscotomentosus]KAG1902401.1 hypothetical protein F5891DRAFT_1023873 [Suillus fuscotomentosus]
MSVNVCVGQTNYYLAQGRGIRRIIALFNNIEDLVTENDRRYDEDAATFDQDHLQTAYDILTRTLPWIVMWSSEIEHNEYIRMIKMLRQGADGARGDDTSKLKALVADWVNRELKPNPLVDPDDKHTRGFINDTCGKLLCTAELDWNNPATKAGIRDRSQGYIVAFKAVFTSPSSAKDVEGEGDGTDIIENNRRARRAGWGLKVKKHVAQIIKMEKVTPRSIAYIACQVRFALSSITLWRTVDGDFDYILFWRSAASGQQTP